MSQMTRPVCVSFISCLVLCMSACTPATNSALRNKIEGKGRLTLDEGNPYLAPNKFLAEEAESSETLKGFLSLRGSPQDLSFKDPVFSKPILTLFYTERNERYKLEHAGKDWIITGPFPIEEKEGTERKDSESLFGSLFSSSTPPLIDMDDKSKTSDETLPENLKGAVTPIREPEEAKTRQNQFSDIFHQVKLKNESIEFLAWWYTEDISNASRIRSINTLPPGPLQEGASIRIPSYLLKKRNAPEENDIKKFRMSFE
jgi:hypothetical protein